MTQTFAEAFQKHCDEVLEPTLSRLVANAEFRKLLATVAHGPGPCRANQAGKIGGNRRVMLKTGFQVDLWFIAWEPCVLMQVRRSAVAGDPEIFKLENLTSAFVERLARVFLDELNRALQ